VFLFNKSSTQCYGNGMGRLTQIKHGDIAQYDYSWDAANRITAMNDAQYGYDATSQLTSAVYEKLPEPVRSDELYEYDANDNRLFVHDCTFSPLGVKSLPTSQQTMSLQSCHPAFHLLPGSGN